jgi:hypothetical protein
LTNLLEPGGGKKINKTLHINLKPVPVATRKNPVSSRGGGSLMLQSLGVFRGKLKM